MGMPRAEAHICWSRQNPEEFQDYRRHNSAVTTISSHTQRAKGRNPDIFSTRQ